MDGAARGAMLCGMTHWPEALARGLPASGCLMLVDARRQRLFLMRRGRTVKVYAVSTARRGLGEREGSFRTPRGWHAVAAWIGHGLRAGSVLVSRRFTGEVLPAAAWRADSTDDRILSRILRLRGLEPGTNCGGAVDSFHRTIYVHGTNHEQQLGRPASHGCIRMANRDVMDLFRRTRGRVTWCWIGE